jgi:CheY-like chemotaxis protein
VRGGPLNRILVIEDDADIRTITALALTSLGGFAVDACASAEEGIERAAAAPPDLILLDVMMPGMDGFDTIGALRATRRTASVPVVFLTARVQPSDVARYERLGCLAVIPKPFEPTALVERIRGLWDRHAGATSPARRRLRALRRSYGNDLPARVQAIQAGAAALGGERWDPQQLRDLYHLVHKMAGSAAVYGFDEVGQAAGQLETWALTALSAGASPGQASALPLLLGALERACRDSGVRPPRREIRPRR